MKKIDFVNGATIDGAETFNDMQSNVEDVFNGEEAMGSIVVDDITSKNLFNPNDVFFKNWLGENGQPTTGNNNDILTNFIKVKPNTKYTISGFSSTEQYLIVVSYNSSKTFNSMLLPSQASSTQTISFTTSANDEYIRCAFSDVNIGSETLQIEKGDATPYKPHEEYGYSSKKSMGKIVVDDISCKNLFDGYFEQGTINDSGAYTDVTTAIRTTNYIKVTPNENYTFSNNEGKLIDRLVYYDENRNFISRTTSLGVKTFTVPANTHYIKFTIASDLINPSDVTKSQLEKGSITTPYTEFKNFEGRVDIITGQECPTNEYIDGKRVYRLRKNLGALPNATRIDYTTGLNNGYVIANYKLYAIKNKLTLPIPFINLSNTQYISGYLDNASAIPINCNFDCSSYSFVVDIEYTKN